MLTGEIRGQIDQVWNAFWSGGISNPLEVIEQITYLLFLKRLDEQEIAEELKANREKKPMQKRFFPEGKDGKERPYQDYRWNRFKNFDPRDMYIIVSEHVFPWLRTLGGNGTTYSKHMEGARFTIPTAALLAKVVDMIDKVPMEDRDTKGDLYEYMLGKIASAGQNGQFRTPRHIIRLMVEMVGDRLGKTIVFAKNHAHAQFISDRFDKNYPHYKGTFARVIDFQVEYGQSLIDDFSNPSRSPHIAISVDMLDTGIDIPEVVNLVFFKMVRSKTKFWQMVGRGTRLRPDLFGPGHDKQYFYMFDYCQNLEFFSQNPETTSGSAADSLSKKLFANRVELIAELDKHLHQGTDGKQPELRSEVAERLRQEVEHMNVNNFIVRPKRRFVEKYGDAKAWEMLSDDEKDELVNQVAGLPSELVDDDQEAKQFDLVILRLQLGLLRHEKSFARWSNDVREIAGALEEKASIPMVRAELELIIEVQTDEFWQDITTPILENIRKRLRSLVKFVEKSKRLNVYTDFLDLMGEERENRSSWIQRRA